MDDVSPLAHSRIVGIVDDDDAIRAALARLVRTIGYQSIGFASGEAVLNEIGQTSPACLLTDIQMPGMNGLDLIKELRQRGHKLPVLVMTAYPSLANRELAMAAGAMEYMTKPLDDLQLEQWLTGAIGRPS